MMVRQRITRVRKIHPLGNMNVNNTFLSNSSNSWTNWLTSPSCRDTWTSSRLLISASVTQRALTLPLLTLSSSKPQEKHLNPSSHTERESSLLSPHCLKNVRKKQNPSTQPITRGLIASIQEAGSSTWRESSPRRNHGGIGNDAPLRPCESRGGREGGTNGSWCKIKHE